MALTVEDGTGLADAESYASVADADSYHALRGNTLWATMSETEKEAALRRATDYLVQAYRLRFKGTRVNGVQTLDWPRNFVEREDFTYATLNGYSYIGGAYYYPSDDVPVEMVQACCLAAFKAASGDLAPDIEPLAIREKVGPIEVERAPGSSRVIRYQALDNILAPLLKRGGGTLTVMRA